MISYYFGGKEGLYAEILKEQFEGFRYIDDIAKRTFRVGDIRAVHPGNDPPVPGESVSAPILRHGTGPIDAVRSGRSCAPPSEILNVLRKTMERGLPGNGSGKGLNPADGACSPWPG